MGFIRVVLGCETFHWVGIINLSLCHIMLFSLFERSRRLWNLGFILWLCEGETFHWGGVLYLALCHIMLFGLFGRRGGLGVWDLLRLSEGLRHFIGRNYILTFMLSI